MWMIIRYALGTAPWASSSWCCSSASAASSPAHSITWIISTTRGRRGAVLAEALSIVGYGYLQQRVLRWGGAELSLASLTLVSIANNAIAYTVPGEPAVSSAYRYRFFRRHGASGASAGWAILTILIAQAIGMSLLLLVGVIVALSGTPASRRAGAVIVGLVRRRDRGRLARATRPAAAIPRARRATVSTHHRSSARRRAGAHRVDAATDARDPTVEWSRRVRAGRHGDRALAHGLL